jgi:signal transduction histidine kinase
LNKPKPSVGLLNRSLEPEPVIPDAPGQDEPSPGLAQNGNDPKKGFGLRGYLFVCFGIVAAVPILILGLNETHRWETVQREAIEREERFVGESLAREVSDHVESHVRAVEALASQVQAMETLDPKAIRSLIASLKSHFGQFSFIYVADRTGRSIVAEPAMGADGKPTAGTDYSDRDYYKQLMRTGKTAISRVQVGKRTHLPNVQIAAPIRDRSGRITGFAEGSLNLTGIQEIADRILQGLPGIRTAIIDEQGHVIAHPDEALRLSVKNISYLPLFEPHTGPDVMLRSGKDDRGIMMRAAVAGVPYNHLDWTVIAYQPESFIEEQSGRARTQAGWVALLALLVGLVFSTLLAAGLSRPVRRLAATATAVGKGVFSETPSAPGSWVPREMAELQTALREMNRQLRNYTKELELRVTARTAQLKESNREMESFVYTVSHDLKAPVVSLYGMASILMEDYADRLDGQGKHYLERVVANAAFMEQLIADLLALSRTGRRVQKPELIYTEDLIESVLVQCQEMMDRKGASVDIDSPLPEVVFDPTQLRQIFLNLLTNAFKFTRSGASPRIEIGGNRGSGYVEFYVRDNGIGIDRRYHDLVFGVFQRLREVEVEGTGVGLAIVKKIIDSAKGKIWIESEPGNGTAVYFRIPEQSEHNETKI